MEESISILGQMKEVFSCREMDIKSYSPLTLAYIGDAIYDLIIRTVVVERGNCSANALHKKTIKYVNAKTQAEMIKVLEPDLSEEELSVYRRGKNAKANTSAKNASLMEYRIATGFEALLGYLYLQDNMDRVMELVKLALDRLNFPI